MHEATLPEFYSVCLSYAPVPVCKDTLPWCCAGTADDQTPWSSDLELHNELKIYAANQRDKNLIRTSRTIRMRHDIDRQRSPFFHQSLRKGQPLAIEKVKSCKLTVERRRDWDEERKKGLFFFCLSLSPLGPSSSHLAASPLSPHTCCRTPVAQKNSFLVRNCDVYGLATPLIYLLTVIVVPHIL